MREGSHEGNHGKRGYIYLVKKISMMPIDNTQNIIEVYNQYAENYAEKFEGFKLYNDTFLQFLELIKSNSALLELGCGPGNVMRYFLNQRPDIKFTGIDLAPEMIKIAKNRCPEAQFLLMDVMDINKFEMLFDAVAAPFCIPYISTRQLQNFFQNVQNKLKSNGTFYLSCMEGLEEKSGFEKTSFTGDADLYIYYHQRVTLEKLIEKYRFKVIKFFTKDYPEENGEVTTDLIYILKSDF